MLRSTTLARLQRMVDETLTQAGKVDRPTRVETDDGGWEDEPQTIFESVACRVLAPDRDPGRAVRGEQAKEAQMFNILFPLGSDVQSNDVVHVGASVFDVLAVETAGVDTCHRVIAMRREDRRDGE